MQSDMRARLVEAGALAICYRYARITTTHEDPVTEALNGAELWRQESEGALDAILTILAEPDEAMVVAGVMALMEHETHLREPLFESALSEMVRDVFVAMLATIAKP